MRERCAREILEREVVTAGVRELVSLMRHLVLTLLVIPLIIVLAVKSPEATGHLVALIITTGAKLLDAVASFINNLFGGH